LEQAAGLENSHVREAVVDGISIAPGQNQARVSEHRKVLAHVRHLATDAVGQIPNGQLALAETLQDAQALGVGQSPGNRG
jgi:hypothetical protein